MLDLNFYKGKKVFITGHTGFKGSWLCRFLINAGAEIYGYSLGVPTQPSLFELSGIKDKITSCFGDIRDFEKLKECFMSFKPEIVIHLAAQPIVRDSYRDPKYTYETNVIGTVNILECVRQSDCVKSFLNVTTDKVYLNNDIPNHPFEEDEPLDGFDPYSNSKSCSELVTHSYKKSFFGDKDCAISTARAGNVIGGGDFANDRIIPDCVRAIKNGFPVIIRNPYSTRPYQHVLEPLYIYLEICEKQYKDKKYEGYYNVGPDRCDCINTGDLATKFCNLWGNGAFWLNKSDGGPHEASFLSLNNQRIKDVFGWEPKWHTDECIDMTVRWTRVYYTNKENIPSEMDEEIKQFLGV